MMEFVRRWAPLLLYSGLALAMQLYVLRWLAGRRFFARNPVRRATLLWSGRALALALSLLPIVFASDMQRRLPANGAQWVLAVLLWYGALLVSLTLITWTGIHKTDLARRRSVKLLLGVGAAAPLAAAAGGWYIARNGIQLREVDVTFPGLPKDLDGLRIAQLTDLHFGPFFGEAEVKRAVAMANEARPHLAAVTGDLITQRGDNLRKVLRLLAGLKADAGVFGCHGNHEIYARCTEAATHIGASHGLRFLRGHTADLRFGNASVRLTGIDYQPRSIRYLPRATNAAPRADAVRILLSHNPDLFPRAAELGYDLTLAGHTHGGQVTVEILHEHLNVARFFTPYTKGLYRIGRAAAYVSPGLGTVGAPVRLGAPPEVSLIRLCAG